MLLIAAFLRATALLIAGYFVWFAARKADGALKTAGNVLAGWCAVFAVVLAVAGITTAVMRPAHPGFGGGFRGAFPGPHMGMMQGRMMGPGGYRDGGPRDGGPRFRFREPPPPQGVPAPKAETPAAAPPAAAPPKS